MGIMEAIIAGVEVNKKKGGNVLDVHSQSFIKKLAEFFKEKDLLKVPKKMEHGLVKCSHANEIAPLSSDWFFTKAAAVVRQIYICQTKTMGVGTLKRMFGMRKRRGRQPPCFATGSGKILREIVKQLRTIGYVQNLVSVSDDGKNNIGLGLTMTKSGTAELDKVASRLLRK